MVMYRRSYVEPEPRKFPNVRAALRDDYRALPAGDLDELVQQTFGPGFAAEDAESFLKTLAKIGSVAAPIVLPAIGTAIGGPAGTAIGAIGGSLASQALAGAAADRPAPPHRPAARRPQQRQAPARPQQRRAVPVQQRPARIAIGRPAVQRPAQQAPQPVPQPQAGTGMQSPAAQLAAVFSRPEFLLALASSMFGAAGRPTVPVGDQDVPVGAMLNLSTVLGQAAASDNHLVQGGGDDGVPSYLFSDSGEALCEVTDDRERAEVLLGRLAEVAAFESDEDVEVFEDLEDVEDLPDIEWDAGEDVLDAYELAVLELDE